MLCLSGFKLYSRWVPLKGWFPLTRIFSVQTHVTFPCVNEIEAMYERPRLNVNVERGSTFTLRVTFHTLPPSPPWLPLFYLRAFIQKNYATVEIHLKTCYVNTRLWWFSRARVVSSTIPNRLIPFLTCFPCARYEDNWRKVSIPTKGSEGAYVVEPWLRLAREQAIQLRENGQASDNAMFQNKMRILGFPFYRSVNPNYLCTYSIALTITFVT